MAARKAVKIGNTRGGRGKLGGNIRTQADYYNAGLSSPLNPGARVTDKQGNVLSGKAKS